MKRVILALVLILSFSDLLAISISGESLENLFPSEENLKAFDFANQDVDFPELKINLITTETGGEIYSYFGHTSLEILIPGYPTLFYDYGYFSFNDGFYRNFILGRLFYNVYATDGNARILSFQEADRSVHRTALNLSTEMENAIFAFLRYNTREENNTYLYDYYLDNCATRVRDIYNEATGGDFKAWAEGIRTGRSLRDWANLHLDKNPIVSFTLNYLEGPSIDNPVNLYQACFLPLTLMHAIEEYESVESQVINTSESRTTYRTLSLEIWTLIFSIVLYFLTLLLYSSKKRAFNRLSDILLALIYIYLTVLSAVLLFMMCFTNHSVTYYNSNLLYANPLIIIMAAEAIRGRRENKRYVFSLVSITLLCIGFIFKAIFPDVFIQENLSLMMLMATIYLINITRHFYIKNKNSL